MRVIEGFHGRRFDKPLTQVRDTIRVVKTLLAGGKLNESGAKLHAYRPFELAMTPARREIPIYVAALKENSISSIGEMADGGSRRSGPTRKWRAGGAGSPRARRSPGAIRAKIVSAPFTTALPMGMEMARDAARQIISFYIGGMGEYYIELLTDFGFGDDCQRIAALYRNKQTRAEAAAAVPDAMLEALAITGDPAGCVAELDAGAGSASTCRS